MPPQCPEDRGRAFGRAADTAQLRALRSLWLQCKGLVRLGLQGLFPPCTGS